MDTCPMQRFVAIYVAHTGDYLLIQKKTFYLTVPFEGFVKSA
jgi:hypothetical protein